MSDTEVTRRQVLDRLVEKLQSDADLLSSQRKKLDEEIHQKKVKLAAMSDQIAAAEMQARDAKASAELLVAEAVRTAESRQAQSENQMREVLSRNRLAEQSANDKREKAMARMTEAVAKAQCAESDYRAKKAMVDGVAQQIQSIQRIVASWKV